MSRKFFGLLALTLALPLAACGDGTDVGNSGTVSLMLTDAPGDFTQAVVTIERIEMVGDGEPLVLMDEPFTTDLLTLSNDVASLVEDVTVPPGTYAQLRFIIPEACISVEQDGGSDLVYASSGFDACGAANGSLQLPSFDETGLKINLPGGSIEVDGDAHILLLDFDVSQSFGQQAGASDMWVMTPVIRAEDISLTGSIVVELTVAEGADLASLGASLGDFQAVLDTEPDTPEAFADPDGDGTFVVTFRYLLPGTSYDVTVELQEDVTFNYTLDPTSPQTVSVASGEDTTISFEVTSASAP